MSELGYRLVAAEAEIRVLREWIESAMYVRCVVQLGMYHHCVYCGHCYGSIEVATPVAAEVMKNHIERCPQHPLSAVKELNRELVTALGRARYKLRAYVGVCKDDKELVDTVLPMADTALAKVGL